MATTSTNQAPDLSHLGVGEEELYDGPEPGNVVNLTPDVPSETWQAPQPQPRPVSRGQYVAMINTALAILGARLLGLIAVVGAVAMFGYAVWDPQPWRTYTVGTYAAVVLWPIVWLYLRRG